MAFERGWIAGTSSSSISETITLPQSMEAFDSSDRSIAGVEPYERAMKPAPRSAIAARQPRCDFRSQRFCQFRPAREDVKFGSDRHDAICSHARCGHRSRSARSIQTPNRSGGFCFVCVAKAWKAFSNAFLVTSCIHQIFLFGCPYNFDEMNSICVK